MIAALCSLAVLTAQALSYGPLSSQVQQPGKMRSTIAFVSTRDNPPSPTPFLFSDGLTEELIADLSSVTALRVISRTSSARFKGSTATPKGIGEALGVHYILEGSVRKASVNLRITARMIDAWTDTQLWAGKYAGTMDDVFDLHGRDPDA